MKRTGKCIHFNGIQNDTCKAGVNYKTLAGAEPGMFRRLPFRDDESTLVCDKRREPTTEEIAEGER